MDYRQKRQAMSIVMALALGLLVGVWIGSQKAPAPEELAIREAEYLEQQRKAAADADYAALQGACTDETIKAVPSGLVARCIAHRWVIPGIDLGAPIWASTLERK